MEPKARQERLAIERESSRNERGSGAADRADPARVRVYYSYPSMRLVIIRSVKKLEKRNQQTKAKGTKQVKKRGVPAERNRKRQREHNEGARQSERGESESERESRIGFLA